MKKIPLIGHNVSDGLLDQALVGSSSRGPPEALRPVIVMPLFRRRPLRP